MKWLKQLKKGDFVAFALILLLAGGIWGLGLSRGTGDLTAEVRQNGVIAIIPSLRKKCINNL